MGGKALLGRLEALSNIAGVSGDEARVRRYIRAEVAPYADETSVDSIGNLYAIRHGGGPRVMLAAHMDEVGMQVNGVLENGLLSYLQAGIDPRVAVSKRVLVGEAAIPGVIGAKAHHLQKKKDFEHVLGHDELFIDIGAKNREDALKYIKIGDYACFATTFSRFGDGLVKGKALDDRAGCAILMELLKNRYDCELVAVFTVQEEVGCRGAEVAVQRARPDLALVLEGTTANDVPGVPEHKQVTCVGKGAAISVMDRGTIVRERLLAALKTCAEQNGVPYQFRRGALGGTDASMIHKALTGCASGGISVPCRYIHSPCSVAAIQDFKSAYRLADAFLRTKAFNEVLCHE